MTATMKRQLVHADPAEWHDAFLAMLPRIETHARAAFGDLDGDSREEAIQEAVCNACQAFAHLVKQGRPEVANASSLGRYAVAQVRDGRRIGTSLNIKDISSRYCQRRKDVKVTSLEHWSEQDQAWQEILVEDKSCTPADLAASRIDYPAFLDSLTRRDRQIAEKLATGEGTSAVARMFRMSAGRVSQLRRELMERWDAFHTEPRNAVPATA